jgi:protocatechuate 3,4-dioxygenase beta subunit
VLFAVCSYVYADTGSVAGRVVDPQGASVAAAKVILTNAGGVKIAETVSDATGAFRFAGVEPGVYRLSAESDAFVRVEAGVA